MKKSLLRKKEDEVLILVESPIAGKGIVARIAIPRNTRIIEYTGQKRKCLPEDEVDPYICLMDLDGEYVIDPRIGGNLARFANHSCQPNCRLIRIGKRIYLDSIKSVKPGQELTFDYNLDLSGEKADNLEAEKELYRCRCGTPKCRGTMLSVESARFYDPVNCSATPAS